MKGNLVNRLMENKPFTKIEVGTDITMYHYSDRTCYHVTDIFDDKHIFVKRYIVCADHDIGSDWGHQNWLYFKTLFEEVEYLKAHGIDREYNPEHEPREEEWVYRYNKWMRKITLTKDDGNITNRERNSLKKKGYYNRYSSIAEGISFGVRNYYYDWSF